MNSNEYMANYMARRRARRRATLQSILGDACAWCSSDERLEFDHKDPATKSFKLSGRALDKPWKELLAELEKCQLLCHDCHMAKSAGECAVEHGEGASGKKNCPCVLCKARMKEYQDEYTKTHVRKRDRS